MNIIYEKEIEREPLKEYHSDDIYHYLSNSKYTECFVITQMKSMYRTIYLNSRYRRVLLPDLINCWKFYKIGNVYLYPSLFFRGLSCYEVKEDYVLGDEVSVLSFEDKFNGGVCTTHSYDNSTFNSFKELHDFFIADWLRLKHTANSLLVKHKNLKNNDLKLRKLYYLLSDFKMRRFPQLNSDHQEMISDLR